MTVKGSTFTFANGGSPSFDYTGSMLPVSQATIVTKQPSSMGYLASTGSKNISKSQEELLSWNSTLEYYNIVNTQKLMSAVGVDMEPLLKPKEPGASTCSLP